MKTRKTDAAFAFAEQFFNADHEARRLVANLSVEFLRHSSIPDDVAPSIRAFRKLRIDQRVAAAFEWIREVKMGPPFARGRR